MNRNTGLKCVKQNHELELKNEKYKISDIVSK